MLEVFMKWVLLRPVARAQDTRTGAQREGGKKKPKFPHPPRERARAIARTFSKGLAKTLSAVPIPIPISISISI